MKKVFKVMIMINGVGQGVFATREQAYDYLEVKFAGNASAYSYNVKVVGFYLTEGGKLDKGVEYCSYPPYNEAYYLEHIVDMLAC